MKKNKIKEKLNCQQLIYISNINKEFLKNNLNNKIRNIDIKKENSTNIFELHWKNTSYKKDNNQNKKLLNNKDNIKKIRIKKVESNSNIYKNNNIYNKEIELNVLKYKMEKIFQRAQNLLYNYDKLVVNNNNFQK